MKNEKKLIFIGLLSAGLLMLFFAKIMYDMVGYVGAMSNNVQIMSQEIVKISRNVELMNKHIDKLDDSIYYMENSMQAMNKDIHSIQTDMAKNIGNINANMNIMRKDMSYGKKTFTSPEGFIKSFTD